MSPSSTSSCSRTLWLGCLAGWFWRPCFGTATFRCARLSFLAPRDSRPATVFMLWITVRLQRVGYTGSNWWWRNYCVEARIPSSKWRPVHCLVVPEPHGAHRFYARDAVRLDGITTSPSGRASRHVHFPRRRIEEHSVSGSHPIAKAGRAGLCPATRHDIMRPRGEAMQHLVFSSP